MYFVGIDLAWGARNRTGVAVLDDDGRLRRIATALTDDDIVEAIEPYIRDRCLVAIDGPLIVVNPTGQRPAEGQLNRDFAPFHAGAHPTNTGNPLFDPPRGAVLADRLGLDMDPNSSAPRRAIEVYPHPATISLFGLRRTLKYKRRNRDPVTRKSALTELADLIEGLGNARPALQITDAPDWKRLRAELAGATRLFELSRCEDPVDAVLCAYVAMYAHRRPADVTIYGDFSTGYIVVPTLPGSLR
ncbi:DUF429 domain-containing protein [Mycolicibacterium sp. XJ1819]